MKLHRFYIGKINLESTVVIKDETLLWQWNKVLRFVAGQEVVLFNETGLESLFELSKVTKSSAILNKVKQQKPQFPSKNIWLFWSLLKRDNNELILQKCTELGVSNFAPIITERTIKKDFKLERAQKIVIEAAEQCGRADIPKIASPIKLEKAVSESKDKLRLFIADQTGQTLDSKFQVPRTLGLLIGPEGGWTDKEQALFEENKIPSLKLAEFTLRAETAAIVATSKLL